MLNLVLDQMTLHAIKQTRKRMHIGISESKTRRVLEEEIAKTGLTGEGGLILFGGALFSYTGIRALMIT
jgi:hypothetical protein